MGRVRMDDMCTLKVALAVPGIRSFLRSQDVLSDPSSQAESIAGRAGNSHVETQVFQNRARARVVQDMTHADMENNTLLKAVHFG